MPQAIPLAVPASRQRPGGDVQGHAIAMGDCGDRGGVMVASSLPGVIDANG